MKEVRIDKLELRERLRENKEAHRAAFVEAHDAFRKRAVIALHDAADKAASGGKVQTHFDLPEPEDHTSDYDRILAMLDMSVDDVIVLTQAEFRQYVQDIWEWTHSFNLTSSRYA